MLVYATIHASSRNMSGPTFLRINDVLGRVTSLPSYPIETSLSNRWMAVARRAFGVHADHAVAPSHHARVREVCATFGEDFRVRCGNVRVRAYDGVRAPVRVPAKGVFFRRRLRVKINHHRVGVCERGGLHQGVKCPEGAVEDFMHEYPPHEIDDGETPRSYRDDVHAASRHGRRIVCGPQDAAAVLLEFGLELFL